MRRTIEIQRAAALLAATCLAAGLWATVTTQITVQSPANTSCTTAIPFCSSLEYTVEEMPVGYVCLWFQFELTGTSQVSMSMTGCKPRLYSAAAASEIGCQCNLGDDVFSFNELLDPGIYFIAFACTGTSSATTVGITVNSGLNCPELPCEGCLPEPMLEEGQEYIINAWVKKEGASAGTVDYGATTGQRPWIKVQSPIGNSFSPCYPSIEQPVVEGWQPIECRFIAGGSSIQIELGVESGTALFDDVRVFPADGSMKCYVYDPHTLRYTAELDERHYATFYEYDLEGKLVRVKKETERGIMTIQESRRNPSHRLP